MPSTTVTLSSKGQLVIPKDIRDALHWEAGTRLILVATAAGVTLQAEPRHAGRRLDDLIGMLKHQGPPLATDDLCRPVDAAADWEESEHRSR